MVLLFILRSHLPLTFLKMAGFGRGGPNEGTSSLAVTDTCQHKTSNSHMLLWPPAHYSTHGRRGSIFLFVPCMSCALCRGSLPAPGRRRAGSWRRSCPEQTVWALLGRLRQQCRFLCAFFFGAEEEIITSGHQFLLCVYF